MAAWKDSGCISMQATRVRSLDIESASQECSTRAAELKPGDRLSDLSGRVIINLRSYSVLWEEEPESPTRVRSQSSTDYFPAFKLNTSCFRTDDTSGDVPDPMDPIGQLNPILPHMA